MNTHVLPNFKRMAIRLFAVLLVMALLLPACARQPQPARIEEITFQSGEFTLGGDLRLPAGTGPFPVVIIVHGSGAADRTLFGLYLPIMERMLEAGYAVFSWDREGYGESTGQVTFGRAYYELAQIVLDTVETMQAHPDLDPHRVGLWGISQGGWVMPMTISQTDEIAFMICVSCGGMSAVEQGAYIKFVVSTWTWLASYGLCTHEVRQVHGPLNCVSAHVLEVISS